MEGFGYGSHGLRTATGIQKRINEIEALVNTFVCIVVVVVVVVVVCNFKNVVYAFMNYVPSSLFSSLKF